MTKALDNRVAKCVDFKVFMRFVSDPTIATKIARMKQRVRWGDPVLKQHSVDQTRLEITGDDSELRQNGFSFLVIGDSGTSRHLYNKPQRHVTERMLEHIEDCEFILHTGDVVYLAGSSEQYPENFIKPYKEFIVGGESPDRVRFDQMTFKLPFLPTLGNHDYYDLPITTSVVTNLFTPLRKLLRRRINLDMGWHGSHQGEGYAKAFIDCLQWVAGDRLTEHLDKHYTAKTETGRCLSYVPGEFTRVPNRYYSFRRGGIDFFALDSNTFNAPQPLPKTESGRIQRQKMAVYRADLEAQVEALTVESDALDMDIPEQSERAAHIYAKVEQLEEQIWDIDKQLTAAQRDDDLDVEQLAWLRNRLVASWKDKSAKGRVLFFHHPPYVTESTKWYQGQTLAVRTNLRQVLDDVEAAVGEQAAGRPLVDLVLNGHAHCFEYLRTVETGHGDRNIPWVVCGGSGFSLRRQRKEGPVLEEYGDPVAECHLFLGRTGSGRNKRRPYTALRVDVKYEGDCPQIVLRPLVAERQNGEWRNYDAEPIALS